MGGLPGNRHEVPEGAMCDQHPDRLAVANVQGETDSFGYETHLMCQECYDEDRAYARSEEARTGRCDWCKQDASDLAWMRDYDEGMHGPVYHVCKGCRDRANAEAQREMDEHDLDYPEDDDWDDDPWDISDECGMTDSGTCMNAGTEWCDFECPHNRPDPAGRAALQKEEGGGTMSDRRVHWRCFHCGETFTKAQERWARQHFGAYCNAIPACQMRVPGEHHLLTRLRKLEDEVEAYRAEDTDLHRAIHAMSADHRQALIREEERGYEKGLRDGASLQPKDTSDV